MNAGLIRLGGILVFVVIAVAIISGFVTGGNKALAIVFGLIQTVLMIIVFWTTKGLFNRWNYRTADIAILGLIVILAVLWLLSLLGGSGVGAMVNPQAMGTALGVIGIVSLIILLLLLVFYIWFAIGSIGFGGIGGGGLWKAIGILYLVGLGLMIVTVLVGIIAALAQSQNLIGLIGIVGLIGALVLLAAWICHGIGLLLGAGKVQQAG